MRKTALVIVMVAAACSPADSADSTTSTEPSTTSTISTAPTTSTTVPAVTTTVPATTTTEPDDTTTTTQLAGTWAHGPLVTTAFGALGWWDGIGWLDAESEGALPVAGGEDYQVIVLDRVNRTTGGAQTTVCEPLDLIGVELAEPDLLGQFPGPYGVAISAPWELQPYLFEEVEDNGTYGGFAAELLSSRGLEVAEPVIKQLFRTDLEGDGIHEVLVVAEDVTPGFIMEEGDYSIAFMRKVVEGEVQTALLGETLVFDEMDQFGAAYSFGGVADLNGDGRMEIIVNAAFFEGFAVEVWEYVNDDLGALQVLQMGCGN
jgi:hypothetical protein